MDRVHARNTLIVLLTIVVLTLGTYVVLLYLVLDHRQVPDLLLAQVTTLTGLLTGSALHLGAQPKVPDTSASAATVVNQNLSQAPGVQVVTDASASEIPNEVYGDSVSPDPGPEVDEPVPGFDDAAGHQFSPDNGPDEVPAIDDPQPQPPKGEF